jgi:hypothetical protein
VLVGMYVSYQSYVEALYVCTAMRHYIVRAPPKGHSSLEPPGTHPAPPRRTVSSRYLQVTTVLSPINVARSTSTRHAVNKWTRGPRIFEYLLTNGERSTLDPCIGNAQSTQGKDASSVLSPNGPPADRAWRAYG